MNSHSKPKSPDERSGLQLSVRDADVSNVIAAQYAIFSALIKLEVSADSGVVHIRVEPNDGNDGDTFEPLNCRFLCRARRDWTCCKAA